jgi:hypothetical protein
VKAVATELTRLLRTREIAPEDIFILAPSVKCLRSSDSSGEGKKPPPLTVFANQLSSEGVPVYVHGDDQTVGLGTDEQAKGKLFIGTFHSVRVDKRVAAH